MLASTNRIQLQWDNKTAREAALISEVRQNERVVTTVMWERSGLRISHRTFWGEKGVPWYTSFVAHLVRCSFEYGDSEHDEAYRDASFEWCPEYSPH